MNNFDKVAVRTGKNSYKWDIKENELPMFVADQDFLCFKPIYDQILEDAKVMAYGYTYVPDAYFKSYHDWFLRVHNIDYKIEDMQFSEGVIATISSVIRHLLNKGDNVTMLTPIYNTFYNSILNNGCKVVESPLINNDGHYEIDYSSLEKCFSISKMFIFCNPHNPVGKCFSEEEIAKISELVKKYNLIVISDEIHCDFLQEGKNYISFAKFNSENDKRTITCIAPSKTFNIAGLKSSVVVVSDPHLRYLVKRAINTDEVAEPSYFAIYPVIRAYNEGFEYVKEMNEYIYQNKLLCFNFIKENIPHLKYHLEKSLYLIWLDASFYQKEDLAEYIREKTGLILSSGNIYGEGAKYFLRMNLATNKENVIEGLKRLKIALDQLEKGGFKHDI